MNKINFQKIAKKVIDEETIAVKKLKKSINYSFDKAVHKILNRKSGKIIFSGTGKSGAAGAILSSTFSSVGIPSFFIDANDAGHGSLGDQTHQKLARELARKASRRPRVAKNRGDVHPCPKTGGRPSRAGWQQCDVLTRRTTNRVSWFPIGCWGPPPTWPVAREKPGGVPRVEIPRGSCWH